MATSIQQYRPAQWIMGLVMGLLFAFSAAASAGQTASGPKTLSDPSDDQACSGIRILHMRPIAEGRMIDLRFRVEDAVKAKAILSRVNKSFLIDQQTGKAMPATTTKAGPMRQTTMEPEAGRIYFTLFSNPRALLKPGGKVTLAVGDIRIRDIAIENPSEALTGEALQKEQQARMARWKTIRQSIQAAYEACAAQCGQNDGACTDICRDARAQREQSEYMRIVYDSPPVGAQ